MNDVRRDFRLNGVDFIYGTIRLIEAESETALPWARENYACVIFNLHIDHRREDVARAADHFRRLIDHALRHGGSYFLTYHRFASAAQVEAAHPAIRAVPGDEAQARSARASSRATGIATCRACSHEFRPGIAHRIRRGIALELRGAVRRARHRPARNLVSRAGLAAGHGRLVSRGCCPTTVLLPAQIAILMLMAVVAWNRRVRNGSFARARPRPRRRCASWRESISS